MHFPGSLVLPDQGQQFVEYGKALGITSVGRHGFHTEGRETEGIALPEGIVGFPGVIVVAFRDEYRVSLCRPMIQLTYFTEVFEVDIRGAEIDGGCRNFVDVHDAGNRAAVWVFTWFFARMLDEPAIDIHGNVILLFSGGTNGVDVRGVSPAHEEVLGVVVVFAENDGPTPLSLSAISCPGVV